MLTMKLQLGLSVIACAAIGSGAGLALAQSSDPAPRAITVVADSSASRPAPPARPQAHGVDAEQSAQFAVLHHAPAPAAELPTGASGPGANAVGANTALARIATASNRDRLVLTPANQALCLVDAGQESCADTPQAESGHLLIVETCRPGLTRGHVRVVGAVPDGVDAVTETTVAGSQSMAVQDNVYAFDSTSAPTSLAWAGHSIPLSVPQGAQTACVGSTA